MLSFAKMRREKKVGMVERRRKKERKVSKTVKTLITSILASQDLKPVVNLLQPEIPEKSSHPFREVLKQ